MSLPGEFQQCLRSLARSRLYTFSVLASLALGIGVATAVVSSAYQLLWRPLPYPESHRLLAMYEMGGDGVLRGVALENFLDWKAQSKSFESMALYHRRSFGLGRNETHPIVVIQTAMTTSEFFEVLGVQPQLGRGFTADEELRDEKVILLGHELWVELFAADPALIGQTVLLNEEPRLVLGILPPGFRFPIASGRTPAIGPGLFVDAYLPLSHRDFGGKRNVRTLGAIGRIHRGVSRESAETELRAIAARLSQAYPETNRGYGAAVRELHLALTGHNRQAFLLLLAATAALLLIVGTNLVNLILSRFVTRAREVAIRLSLGAGVSRIATSFLLEGLLLTSAGASLGLLLARTLLAVVPQVLPVLGGGVAADLALSPASPASLWSAFGLALTMAAVFAIVPTTLARRATPLWMRDGLTGSSRGRLRSALVVAQLASSLVLLQGTGLLVRSFAAVVAIDPGFRTSRVWTFGLGLPEHRYDSDRKMAAFHKTLIGQLELVPGVESVGAATGRLLAGHETSRISFLREGELVPAREWPSVSVRLTSPDYFRSIGIPLLDGRGLSWRDDLDAPRVFTVNRTFAETFDLAVGSRLLFNWRGEENPEGTVWEMVGVVADAHQLSLEQAPSPEIFLPIAQFPAEWAIYTIKAKGIDPALPELLGETVAKLDPRIEKVRVHPASDWIAASLSERRLSLVIAGLMALAALLLAAIGIYGLLAFWVGQRRKEIALRMALGAGRRRIQGLVLGQGIRYGLVGLVLGVAGFTFSIPILRHHLFGIGGADPVTSAIVLLLTVAMVLLACYRPSAVAARTSPMELLREE